MNRLLKQTSKESIYKVKSSTTIDYLIVLIIKTYVLIQQQCLNGQNWYDHYHHHHHHVTPPYFRLLLLPSTILKVATGTLLVLKHRRRRRRRRRRRSRQGSSAATTSSDLKTKEAAEQKDGDDNNNYSDKKRNSYQENDNNEDYNEDDDIDQEEIINVGHIEDVVVDRQIRGQGLGKFILSSILSLALDKNCQCCILNCDRKNIPFYKKCGYYYIHTRW